MSEDVQNQTSEGAPANEDESAGAPAEPNEGAPAAGTEAPATDEGDEPE